MDKVVTVFEYTISWLIQKMDRTLQYELENGKYVVKDIKPIYYEPNSEKYIQTAILELKKDS